MDIGRSTADHLDRYEINYSVGNEALDNYGAWFRSADDGSQRSIVQPMFREIKQGYRTASEMRTQYDEDYAIQVDAMMAKLLSKAEIRIVFCHYVYGMSSRVAAKSLSNYQDRVTHTEYAMRLEAVVGRVDMAIFLITEKSALVKGQQTVYGKNLIR